MRIVIGSDRRTATTDEVVGELRRLGHEVELRGPLRDESMSLRLATPIPAQEIARLRQVEERA